MNVTMQELLDRMKETEDKNEYKKLQAMQLYKIEKMKAIAVAKIVGTTPGMIYHWASAYKKNGIQAFVKKPKGGRRWAYMSLEKEKALLEELENDASKGFVVLSKVVRQKANEKLKKTVSADYAEDILNRHGWRKIEPRPKHPKSSKADQEEFKKKHLTLLKKQ